VSAIQRTIDREHAIIRGYFGNFRADPGWKAVRQAEHDVLYQICCVQMGQIPARAPAAVLSGTEAGTCGRDARGPARADSWYHQA
jgi:hypothetical protein